MPALPTFLVIAFLVIAFLGTALLGTAVLRFAPPIRDKRVFHLDRFRPAAPLAGLLPGNRDDARAYADIQAAYSRHGLAR